MVEKKKSSTVDVSISKFYKIQGDKVVRAKRDCPRCGKGVFMAEHRDRYTCGKCGFTEFTYKEMSKKSTTKHQI